MSKWKIFCWAMLHSPEFGYCCIHLPIRFGFRRIYNIQAPGLVFELQLRRLAVYVPWSVENAYLKAHNVMPKDYFDDIPF